MDAAPVSVLDDPVAWLESLYAQNAERAAASLASSWACPLTLYPHAPPSCIPPPPNSPTPQNHPTPPPQASMDDKQAGARTFQLLVGSRGGDHRVLLVSGGSSVFHLAKALAVALGWAGSFKASQVAGSLPPGLCWCGADGSPRPDWATSKAQKEAKILAVWRADPSAVLHLRLGGGPPVPVRFAGASGRKPLHLLPRCAGGSLSDGEADRLNAILSDGRSGPAFIFPAGASQGRVNSSVAAAARQPLFHADGSVNSRCQEWGP